MKTTKSLKNLSASVGGFVEVLKFRGNGQEHKGYAIVDIDGNELIEIEPVWYSNGDRWKVRNRSKNETIYVKTLRGLDKNVSITAGYTGFKFRGYLKQLNVSLRGFDKVMV